MRRIFDEIGETVDCSVLDGDHVRVIHGIRAHHRLRVTTEIGSTFPLYCSAKGQAILAAYPPEVAARMLPDRLERLTGKTVTDRGEMLECSTRCARPGWPTTARKRHGGSAPPPSPSGAAPER